MYLGPEIMECLASPELGSIAAFLETRPFPRGYVFVCILLPEIHRKNWAAPFKVTHRDRR